MKNAFVEDLWKILLSFFSYCLGGEKEVRFELFIHFIGSIERFQKETLINHLEKLQQKIGIERLCFDINRKCFLKVTKTLRKQKFVSFQRSLRN